MSLKDATTFDHLNETNYEEWRPNVLNLLNSRNFGRYTEHDYSSLIKRARAYQSIQENELFSFITPATSSSSSKAPSVVEPAQESEKGKISSISKTRSQLRVLRDRLAKAETTDPVNKALVHEYRTSVVRAEEELDGLISGLTPESELELKKDIPAATSSATLYPGKSAEQIESHLKSVRELEDKSVKAHALISASIGVSLRSFVSHLDANPYKLWITLEERFRNRTVNLTTNLELFYSARKNVDEKLVDYNARLARLRLLLSSSTYKVDDEIYLTTLLKGLPPEYNSARSIITLQSPTLEVAITVLLNHERILDQQDQSSSSALYVKRGATKSDNNKSRGKSDPKDSTRSQDRGRRGDQSDRGGSGQRRGRGRGSNTKAVKEPSANPGGEHGKSEYNGDHFCQHCERPGHTIHVCRKFAASQGNAPKPSAPKTAQARTKPSKNKALAVTHPSASEAVADYADAEYDSDESVYFASTDNKQASIYALSSLNESKPRHALPIFDTGCSGHLTGSRELLHGFVHTAPTVARCANGETITCVGRGILRGTIRVNGKPVHVAITGVQYVPEIKHTLLSPLLLGDKGLRILWDPVHGFQFLDGDALKLFSIRKGNLLVAPMQLRLAASPTPDTVAFAVLNLDLQHRRLGHASEARCRDHVRQSPDYTDREKSQILRSSLDLKCTICAQGKQAARPIGKAPKHSKVERATRPGELLSADLVGPIDTPSISGARYILTVTDSFSRFHWSRPIRLKSDAFARIREIVSHIPLRYQPRAIRFDNGGEFSSKGLRQWLEERGIAAQPTTPYTSALNGIAERFNRELLTRVRCLLLDAKLGHRFWAEAVQHATMLINVSPSRANPGRKSPYELWHSRPPRTRHFRVFGSAGTMLLPGKHKSKLQPRSIPVRYLGNLDYSSSIYRVLVVATGRATHTRNVVFGTKFRCISPEDAGIEEICYDDLEWMMEDPVVVWGFGHTHWSSDNIINSTRVVSNQCGYITTAPDGKGSNYFDPAMVVDVRESLELIKSAPMTQKDQKCLLS